MAIYKDVSSLEVVGYTEPKNGTFSDGVQFVLEKLDAIPEADVVPIVHAHWIPIKGRMYACNDPVGEICTVGYICSKCGKKETAKYIYCRCGARMDEEVEK